MALNYIYGIVMIYLLPVNHFLSIDLKIVFTLYAELYYRVPFMTLVLICLYRLVLYIMLSY